MSGNDKRFGVFDPESQRPKPKLNVKGQRIDHKEMEGKTVAFTFMDDDCIGIRFTDGTYFFARGVFQRWSNENDIGIREQAELTPSESVYLGIISEEEYDRYIREMNAYEEAKKREERRKEYLRLAREFGGQGS
jgi:hypothetical protein